MSHNTAANVYAYKGFLILEQVDKCSSARITTSVDTPDHIGQVVHDTANNLGVSKEAIELLQAIERGSDSLGTIDWLECADGTFSFGWIGNPYAIKDPADCVTSQSWQIGPYVLIPNTPPEGAMYAVDNS